jgi:hypothetical protein
MKKKYIAPLCEWQELQASAAMAVSADASMEGLTNKDIDINWFE